MNSVMEIADKIIFIHEGKLWWQGTKETIWTTDNVEVNRFIFASELTKKIREAYV